MIAAANNPWGTSFRQGLFNMTNDSHLFHDAPAPERLPLYEAKMIHQFDHRWATYETEGRLSGRSDFSPTVRLIPSGAQEPDLQPKSRELGPAEKRNPDFTVTPRYWVDKAEVEQRLRDKGWDRGWLLGWRDICRSTDERTVIASVLPRVGVGHTMPLFTVDASAHKTAALMANFDSLVLDFMARQKIGGTHLTYGYLKQFPVLPPDSYTPTDLDFIVPRVLELTYTAHDMKPWADDLLADRQTSATAADPSPLKPFPFDPIRRARLRAELDAWYAKAYGLSRDELRYLLDPADVEGDDYPSETFRVLKNNELKEFGEYRTRRLVLEAWDKLESGELVSWQSTATL